MRQDQQSLVTLGRWLRQHNYDFVTPTPSTHARVLRRAPPPNCDPIREFLGWNRTLPRALLGQTPLLDCLQAAGALEENENAEARSRVRFSRAGNLLFLHSAFPTDEADAVFFGPDSYRFLRVIAELLSRLDLPPRRIADIGSGSGVGGIYCASVLTNRPDIFLCDINEKALSYSTLNARINDVGGLQPCKSDVLDGTQGSFDLMISNPPFLVDAAGRNYRHGGGLWGCDLSLRILHEAMPRLAKNGVLLLYTATPVVNGRHILIDCAARDIFGSGDCWRFEEIDPDIFGEELNEAPYRDAERIAAITIEVRRGA